MIRLHRRTSALVLLAAHPVAREEMVRSFKAPPGSEAAPGWAQVAGYALGQVDQFLGKLGKPIGIASYKPFQSSREDFLQNYLGNIVVHRLPPDPES